VRIATHCVIVPANHRFDSLDVPIARQPVVAKGISVEDDVWIGANSVILDGVTIGTGSVIGAGSVVTRDIQPFSVCVGNPARVIGIRRGLEHTP
jgi:acetyltransferase-like isoleucine patch superfamily enzyme